METVASSFTAVGNGTGLSVAAGKYFNYSVSGTFVGTVILERTRNGGLTYTQIGSAITSASSGNIFVETPNGDQASYRFRCTAFTSGTIVTSMSDFDEFNFKNLPTASAVSLSTGTAKTVTSLDLPAGRFDIVGVVVFKPAASTSVTLLGAAISQTTDAVPSIIGQASGGELLIQKATAANVMANDDCVTVPSTRVTLDSPTTIYLTAKATFSVSTMAAYGSLRALKV